MFFITSNKGKFEEMNAIVGGLEQLDLDLDEIQELDAKRIIEHKLLEAKKQGYIPCMVEDTSLYCDGLHGLPGPFIRWFEKSFSLKEITELIQKTEDTKAHATTIIGYADKNGLWFFEGTIHGNIVLPKGTGFGWYPIFQLDGDKRTFGEMTKEEKIEYGMRGQAARKLAEFLKNNSQLD